VVLPATTSKGQGGGDLKEGAKIIGHRRHDRIGFVGDYEDNPSSAAASRSN
jgi:hypothetical protein